MCRRQPGIGQYQQFTFDENINLILFFHKQLAGYAKSAMGNGMDLLNFES